jgi:hypothetical protein
MGLKKGETLLSITYMRDGVTYTTTRATEAEIERWHKAGLIDKLDGTCTCGSDDFCDTIAHRRVRCFEDSAGVCNWHTTTDYC